MSDDNDTRDRSAEQSQCENTDRELWREREADYYADSIHVTKDGRIGMNCGGYVIVLPIRKWHEIAKIYLYYKEGT